MTLERKETEEERMNEKEKNCNKRRREANDGASTKQTPGRTNAIDP